MAVGDNESPMPIFYFDVYNDDVTLDDEGAELADVSAAHAHAVKEARVLAAETVKEGHFDGRHRIDVRDESRADVASVTFGEAVEIRSCGDTRQLG